MTTWITLDCEIGSHPKMAALPSDTARYGWILTLTEAKKQRQPGRFASERHFRHVLARHGRFVADYIKAGLLEREADGALAVHDWQRHQWAVAKAGQRETPAGHREDTGETSQGHEVDASRAVRVSVPIGVSQETDGVEAVLAWLAGRKVSVAEAGRVHIELARIVDQHGSVAVIAAMAGLPAPLHDGAQYVYGARNVLNPIPQPSRGAKAKGYQPETAAAVGAFNRPLRTVPFEDLP